MAALGRRMLGLGRSDADADGEPQEAARHLRLLLALAWFGHIDEADITFVRALEFAPENALAREERRTLVAPQSAA